MRKENIVYFPFALTFTLLLSFNLNAATHYANYRSG
jgi:hypothetical protein